MVQNGSKTDHVEHLGALRFEMIQNATKTAQFGVSELPWARNCLKCKRSYSFGIHVSEGPWDRNGSERDKMAPQINILEHQDGLGSSKRLPLEIIFFYGVREARSADLLRRTIRNDFPFGMHVFPTKTRYGQTHFF